MKWININDRMPDVNEEVLCWSVKFGDQKRSKSSHAMVLIWDGIVWQDKNGKDYENNPDYHLITHWACIESPNRC